MSIFEKLQEDLKTLENEKKHDGYWYTISDALLVLICGMLCGLGRIEDIHDWAKSKPARKFLDEQFGIKKIFCLAQFYNLLARIKADEFHAVFSAWMKYILSGTKALERQTVSIDGKTICSTNKLTHDGSVLHIASAIISELNLVIGQLPCDTKTDEITVFRDLIKLLDVAGSIVVADALHCNEKSCETVIQAGADYLFVVKDNQSITKEAIELYVQSEKLESAKTIETNGGRIEKRAGYVARNVDWLETKERFKNLKTIGAIHREFIKDGKTSSEWHYYISSANLTAEELLKHARLEWAVESMHWLLDVHFNEDKTAIWDMNVQQLLNITRKIALNLVRIYKHEIESKKALSKIMRENLFDMDQLAAFIDFFRNENIYLN